MVTVGPWPSGPPWFLAVLLLFDTAAALVFAALPRRSQELSGRAVPTRGRAFGLLLSGLVLAYLPLLFVFGPSRWALSQEEFDACFAAPMRDVTSTADPQADIWPYVDGLDLDILGVPSVNDVRHVYRDALDRFDQVLIGTGRFNTLLVVVVDRELKAVHGHRLLELNKVYGGNLPDIG